MRQMGGFADLTPGRASDGVRAIQERAYRIIDTPVGALPQDPEWGWGLADQIGIGLAPGDLRVLEQVGRAAFKRDPEIVEATVTITLDGNRATVNAHLETMRGPADIERDLAIT